MFDIIMNKLRHAHSVISNIIVELASIPNANKDLIETGNFLTKLITKAMVITGNRLSLDKMENGFKSEHFWNYQLSNWMCAVLLYVRKAPEKFEKLDSILSYNNLSIVNDLEGIVKESMDIIKTEEEKRKKSFIFKPIDSTLHHRLIASKQKVRCLICGGKGVIFKRYTEHFKRVHNPDFIAKGRKVNLFHGSRFIVHNSNIIAFRFQKIHGWHCRSSF